MPAAAVRVEVGFAIERTDGRRCMSGRRGRRSSAFWSAGRCGHRLKRKRQCGRLQHLLLVERIVPVCTGVVARATFPQKGFRLDSGASG